MTTAVKKDFEEARSKNAAPNVTMSMTNAGLARSKLSTVPRRKKLRSSPKEIRRDGSGVATQHDIEIMITCVELRLTFIVSGQPYR